MHEHANYNRNLNYIYSYNHNYSTNRNYSRNPICKNNHRRNLQPKIYKRAKAAVLIALFLCPEVKLMEIEQVSGMGITIDGERHVLPDFIRIHIPLDSGEEETDAGAET